MQFYELVFIEIVEIVGLALLSHNKAFCAKSLDHLRINFLIKILFILMLY